MTAHAAGGGTQLCLVIWHTRGLKRNFYRDTLIPPQHHEIPPLHHPTKQIQSTFKFSPPPQIFLAPGTTGAVPSGQTASGRAPSAPRPGFVRFENYVKSTKFF